MTQSVRTRISNRAFVIGSLIVSAVVAGLAIFFASGSPDGLEHVAETQGFGNTATEHATGGGPFADYQASFADGPAGGLIAAATGIAVTGLLMWLLLRALRAKGPSHESHTERGAPAPNPQ